MKQFLSLTGLMALVAISVYAAPVCLTTPPNNNLLAGLPSPDTLTATSTDTYVPCTAGALTFNNVSYDLDMGSFTTATPIVSVIATPLVGSDQTLEFNPNLAVGSDLLLEYQVTGPDISDVTLSFNGTGTGFVNEVVCTRFFSTGACPSADLLGTINVNASTPTAVTVTFPSQPEVWVFKDIASGSAPFSEVFQDYSYVIPEPATLSLMGMGLLGIGLLGRRRLFQK